jgi:hypothetical protein
MCVAVLTITVEPDELLGLNALGQLDTSAFGAEADAASVASALMHERLAARLDELGLPWAPSPEAVAGRAAGAAAVGEAASQGALRKLIRDERVKKYGTTVLVVAALVALWGGYVQKWQWTGFPANDQLWDWLHLLLLLPLVFPTTLLPALLKWVSGNAAERAEKEAEEAKKRPAPVAAAE